MSRTTRLVLSTEESTQRIAHVLRTFLVRKSIQQLVVAEGNTPPPQLAYLVSFPRLTLVLTGSDNVELEQEGKAQAVQIPAGAALLVPPNCWDRPTWSSSATALTFLFGKRQTGITLIRQKRGSDIPTQALKTHLASPTGPEASLLSALLAFARRDPKCPEALLLIQPLLHSYLRLLLTPQAENRTGKANHTFQNLCLYIQENFQFPLTRESVAEYFRISPNHVSRLFRAQGYMRFNDYLNLVRIDRAKYLLRRHDLTVDEIAASCGYNETAYFCRAFKKRTNLTPTHFRSKYANQPLDDITHER